MPRPRALVLLLFGLAGFPVLTGCLVPKNRYDRAVQAGNVEQARRTHALAQLATARAEVERLTALLRERGRHVDDRERDLSRSKLDEARLETERNDAATLVEQLRGELARAGDHLREYAEQKEALEAALAQAALGAPPPAEPAAEGAVAESPEGPEADRATTAPTVAAPATAPLPGGDNAGL